MIYLGSDHAGFAMKEEIRAYLAKHGFEVEDLGAFSLQEQDDYPDFILPVAKRVAEEPAVHRGIILGGSGQGEAIAANKVKGVRAACYYGGPEEIVEVARTHNDANVLSLGARFLSSEEALRAVRLFLDTPFEGERHERRLEKIRKFEEGSA